MNKHVTVNVAATDIFGNQASCKFQVVLKRMCDIIFQRKFVDEN